MAKWAGVIGFGETVETTPGVWEDVVTERKYRGDLLRFNRRTQTASQINDDINISNQLSIIADPYANNNIFAMRYAVFRGAKWKITSVEVKYPRLILELGGVYNE